MHLNVKRKMKSSSVALSISLLAGTIAPSHAQIAEARHQAALDTMRRFAMDIAEAWPCFVSAMPETMWEKNKPEAQVQEVLVEYEKSGATREQVENLHRVFETTFQPKMVGDVRDLSRKCNGDGDQKSIWAQIQNAARCLDPLVPTPTV